MRLFWFIYYLMRKKQEEPKPSKPPVSVLDSIINDRDWYRAKPTRKKTPK